MNSFFFLRYILVEEKKLRKLHTINDINWCVGGGGALRAGGGEITVLLLFLIITTSLKAAKEKVAFLPKESN